VGWLDAILAPFEAAWKWWLWPIGSKEQRILTEWVDPTPLLKVTNPLQPLIDAAKGGAEGFKWPELNWPELPSGRWIDLGIDWGEAGKTAEKFLGYGLLGLGLVAVIMYFK
jgi:hypothetical protein